MFRENLIGLFRFFGNSFAKSFSNLLTIYVYVCIREITLYIIMYMQVIGVTIIIPAYFAFVFTRNCLRQTVDQSESCNWCCFSFKSIDLAVMYWGSLVSQRAAIPCFFSNSSSCFLSL